MLEYNPNGLITLIDNLEQQQNQSNSSSYPFKVLREKGINDEFIVSGELFCGPGGLGLGLEEAFKGRIIHQWANDISQDACNTYNFNIKPKKIICEDVHTLDIDKLDNINSFFWGFPCNSFSTVGEQEGLKNKKYGSLYTYGIKVIRKFQPLFFVAENVSGLSSANSGKAFKKILTDMKDSGYDLFPNLYCFEKYGIPQARHRIIVVAFRQDLQLTFKIPSTKGYKIKTCKEAIENPPIPEDAPNNEKAHQSAKVIARLKHIKPGENAFTAKLPPELSLNVNGAKISQIYKRLDPNKPSYTVTGSGGGGTSMYHWSEPRALTNRERARLQTFPDSFIFKGSKESVRKQIGMAVPVEGARIIFEAIRKTLDGEDYPYDEPNIRM